MGAITKIANGDSAIGGHQQVRRRDTIIHPLAEYFPPPGGGGALDDDTLFWELFADEPEAVGGYITLPERPGLGWTLREDAIRSWS